MHCVPAAFDIELVLSCFLTVYLFGGQGDCWQLQNLHETPEVGRFDFVTVHVFFLLEFLVRERLVDLLVDARVLIVE